MWTGTFTSNGAVGRPPPNNKPGRGSTPRPPPPPKDAHLLGQRTNVPIGYSATCLPWYRRPPLRVLNHGEMGAGAICSRGAWVNGLGCSGVGVHVGGGREAGWSEGGGVGNVVVHSSPMDCVDNSHHPANTLRAWAVAPVAAWLVPRTPLQPSPAPHTQCLRVQCHHLWM